MASIIDELLQSGAVPPEELAKLLRERESVGMVGQLSGSNRIGPLGASMRSEALNTASELGQGKQKVTLESWKAQMAAASRAADRDSRANEGRLNRASRENVARMRGQQMLAGIDARAKSKFSPNETSTIDSFQTTLDSMGSIADKAREAQGMSGMMSAGLGSVTKIIPGSPARNLDEFLEPVRSSEALTKLSELRAQAQAMGQKGSGLGQVTERELSLLMNARENLATAQGEAQLDRALMKLEKQYRSSMRNIQREIDKLRANDSGESSPSSFAEFMHGLDSEADDAAYDSDENL